MSGNLLRRKNDCLIIQDRDKAILEKVFQYRLLDAGQAQILCRFSLRKRVNDRLRKMFRAGFLSRRLLADSFERKLFYFPGPRAAEIISSAFGVDPLEVNRRRLKTMKLRNSFLPHLARINHFRFCLETAFQKESSSLIENWRYKKALFLTEDRKVFPDAYARFRRSGETFNCFLDIDRSIESRRRIFKRISFYLEYALSGAFEKQFSFKYFRLLVICKTMVRLRTVLRVIEKASDKSFCWLAVEKDITPEKILSAIWLRSNKEGRFAL